MYQYRKQIIKLVTTCGQICLIYLKIAWASLIRLKNHVLPRLKHFSLISQQAAKTGWRMFVAGIIKFVKFSKVYGKASGSAAVKLFHQIIKLLKQLGRYTLKLSRMAWKVSVNTTEKFIQYGIIILKACRRASIKLSRYIAQLSKRLGRSLLTLSKITSRILINIFRWFGKLLSKLVFGFYEAIKVIYRSLIRLFHQSSKLLKSSGRYLWKTWLVIWERLYQYARLVRLNKPIGILLLLWPTLWALWIAAEGKPDSIILLIFISGVVLMRSAGCAINDIIDRDFDTHVTRTQDRPIASGMVTPREAMDVAILLILIAFILVLFLNSLSLKLSIVAVVLAIIYPFMKRITYLPQFFLGLAFAWSIPLAFAAQTNSVPVIAWLLLLTTVLWAVAYDTMYAMVDREDDIHIGVRSTAILFDDADRFIIGCIQLLVLIALIMIGNRIEMSQYYYAGIAAAAILSLYQQFLIKDRIPEKCFRAFLNNNWFRATVFPGIFCHYHFY